jgi:hypothetical protein
MFKLEIETDNYAFDEPGPEVARILREVADRVEQLTDKEPYGGNFKDVNGHTVGWFDLS